MFSLLHLNLRPLFVTSRHRARNVLFLSDASRSIRVGRSAYSCSSGKPLSSIFCFAYSVAKFSFTIGLRLFHHLCFSFLFLCACPILTFPFHAPDLITHIRRKRTTTQPPKLSQRPLRLPSFLQLPTLQPQHMHSTHPLLRPWHPYRL